MIIVVCGPTASKKSKLAQQLAKIFHAKIMNADAFQVYKELNIGVNKPSKKTIEEYDYQLIDFLSIDKPFSIFDFQKLGRYVIDETLKKGENLIIEGGSGLYLRALLFDYNFDEKKNDNLDKYAGIDNETLYKKLIDVDPISAKSIHQNNRKRVIRALDIFEETGITKSEHISRQKHELVYDHVYFVSFDVERKVLYDNIDLRVDKMWQEGLKNEVLELIKTHDPSLYALQAIGYKEVIEGIKMNQSESKIIERIKKNTRNYAKRQLTFLRHQLPVRFFDDFNDIIKYLSEVSINGPKS